MGAPIDTKKRNEVVADYLRRKAENPKTSYADVAADHGVGRASLNRWLRQWREEKDLAPKTPVRRGAQPKLTSEQGDAVAEWAKRHPGSRLWEVVDYIEATFGVRVGETTARRILHQRNVGKRRLTKLQASRKASEEDGAERRYTDAHRRKPEPHSGRRAYPSDFTHAEWQAIEPVWREHARAVPRDHELRDVVEALRYIGATGMPWRYLPHDFPPHGTVRRWFDTWTRDGTITRVNDAIRRSLRRRAGRHETPSVLIIDSLSVKSHEGGEDIGYDGGKKVRGRKRHIAVDTLGLPWLTAVHSAHVQDRDGIDQVVPSDIKERLPRLEKILADAGYQGRCEKRTLARTGVPIEIVRRRGDNTNGEWASLTGPAPTMTRGFKVLPKRWIVERSLAWGTRRRRLARDFERTTAASHAWLELSFQHVMVARLAG